MVHIFPTYTNPIRPIAYSGKHTDPRIDGGRGDSAAFKPRDWTYYNSSYLTDKRKIRPGWG